MNEWLSSKFMQKYLLFQLWFCVQQAQLSESSSFSPSIKLLHMVLQSEKAVKATFKLLLIRCLQYFDTSRQFCCPLRSTWLKMMCMMGSGRASHFDEG